MRVAEDQWGGGGGGADSHNIHPFSLYMDKLSLNNNHVW